MSEPKKIKVSIYRQEKISKAMLNKKKEVTECEKRLNQLNGELRGMREALDCALNTSENDT